jgi:hypothetical protein
MATGIISLCLLLVSSYVPAAGIVICACYWYRHTCLLLVLSYVPGACYWYRHFPATGISGTVASNENGVLVAAAGISSRRTKLVVSIQRYQAHVRYQSGAYKEAASIPSLSLGMNC